MNDDLWGVHLLENGHGKARIWAPAAEHMSLEIGDRTISMDREETGWFEAHLDQPVAGEAYRFVKQDGRKVADPASRWQAGAVDGSSLVTDPKTYSWIHRDWPGRPWHEAVTYELHVGTFTAEGTFLAAARKLKELAELGFTAIELMPVAAFHGERGWGYDGVLAYAPHPAYGKPDDLKHLVDCAHGASMMVILDVVYNHFGIYGNMLEQYAPQFFLKDSTPWGPAPDFSRKETRSYFIENALYWLSDFRFDGLRFDAADRLVAQDQPWLVDEIADRARNLLPNRTLHLVAEDARHVTSPLEWKDGRAPSCRAVWNDDFHHAVHVLATGETVGHYADFAAEPSVGVRTALAEGFIYQGQARPSKEGKRHGEPSGHLPPTCFVNFLQNHDQIGNRLKGDRLSGLVEEDILKALTAMLYLSPQIPLAFMGDEFGTTQSFYFFSDYPSEVHEAGLKARMEEARNFGGSLYEKEFRAPDPNKRTTFLASKLQRPLAEDARSTSWREFVRELLAKRRSWIWPMLERLPSTEALVLPAPDKVIAVDWRLGNHKLELRCNLGREVATSPTTSGEVFYSLLAEPGTKALPPGGAIFASSGQAHFQG